MSNEMIERVAAAMADGAWSTMKFGHKEYWRARAVMAIEEMREPTAAMMKAESDGFTVELLDSWSADDVWRAMIDAALKED